MRKLFAIVKRELRAYFYSPIAYVMIVIFLAVSGFFFYSGMTFYGKVSFEMSRMAQMMGPQELSLADFVLRPLFVNMSVIMLLITPLLTMRLFAEEKKTGSAELLFTWPLKDTDVALGKYIATVLVFAIMLGGTFLFTGLVWWHAQPPWAMILTGYLGLLLLGASFISLGAFVSTLTENQIVSAVISFGALLIFWAGAWTMGDKTGLLADVVNYLSILKHFENFSKGVIDTRDVVYYLSFVFAFQFLTLRSLESKRWRG